ncbi:hypothetical protein BC937DRAFT_86726, partial [Endogone sp. FLAS-F59071]
GKTNQFGQLEVSGAIRHKEVQLCLLSHLAIYFFWCWHIENEPFPNFAIIAKAKTHVAHGSGTRMVEVGGASNTQIHCLGRWNNSAMVGCYLTTLPCETMSSLAGFLPGSRFYLLCAAVQPEETLLKKVFPDIDHWLQAQETGIGCEPNIAADKWFSTSAKNLT